MGKVLVGLICVLAVTGCSANRVSGWNDEDARLLAAEAAADILAGSWLEDFSSRAGHSPHVLLAGLDNQSGEQFSLRGLQDALIMNLLASGGLRMILPRPEADIRTDSLGVSGPPLTLEQSGADVILQGSLMLVPEKGAPAFLLELRLTDAHSGELLHRCLKARRHPGKEQRPA